MSARDDARSLQGTLLARMEISARGANAVSNNRDLPRGEQSGEKLDNER